jgi:short-subunit dehydrogenase
MGGKIHTPLGAWYHGTKFALEAISDCLRIELQPFGIDVVVIEPGGIKTEWAGIAAQQLLKTSGHGAYAPQAAKQRPNR